jgi:hypothetical protein
VTIKWLLQLLADCCNSKINSKDFHTQVSLLATLFFGRNVFILFFSEFFPVTVTEITQKTVFLDSTEHKNYLIFLQFSDTYCILMRTRVVTKLCKNYFRSHVSIEINNAFHFTFMAFPFVTKNQV